MQHIIFNKSNSYKIAILIKESSLNYDKMMKYYVNPLTKNLNNIIKDLIGFSLKYDINHKATVKFQKSYLAELLPALKSLGIITLYVADSNYFKTLTGMRKADPYYGYVIPCVIKDYEYMNVVLATNYTALFYNPLLQKKLDLSLTTLSNYLTGNYKNLGNDIIHSEQYPKTLSDIEQTFKNLHQHKALTCDIEAFSLRFYKAGIGTIAFAWNEHNGVAFSCDYTPHKNNLINNENTYGYQQNNLIVKKLFREFLETYKGKLIWHNLNYDGKLCIYNLWMDDILDIRGLIKGMEIITNNFDDTQIISYLAVNSCTGNKLGLKEQAHEFAGNWAQDNINDIRKIPLPDLLKYNLIDCLSTWYVYNKNYPIIIKDKQEDIYKKIMKPSVKTILQTELTGMSLDMDEVKKVRIELENYQKLYQNSLNSSSIIINFNKWLQKDLLTLDFESRCAKAKHPQNIKKKDISDFQNIFFNPNSNLQIQKLLFSKMNLPIIDLTKTKQPSVSNSTLKKLINHTSNLEYLLILENLIGLSEVTIIINTFINAFETKSFQAPDGQWYLFGSFKIGGTVSGRLSSSDPNLQNIPSTGSKYAKHIKRCFKAPEGWIWYGADFDSLEDKISALTTRDPNKLKVYTGIIIYKLIINNITHYIREDSTITYNNKTYTGIEFYNLYG